MNTPDPASPEQVRLSLREIVGWSHAVRDEDAQRVFDRIVEAFRGGHRVELSFANVELTIAAFLNAVIGQLYGVFTEEEIRARLSVVDIDQRDLALIKLVVDNAKAYFHRQRKDNPALLEQLATLTPSHSET